MAQPSTVAFYRFWQTADLRREIFSWLGYVEIMALCRALQPRVDCQGFLPDFRPLLEQRLPFAGPWPAFWSALQQAGALLHGSFLLHCLLAPLGQVGRDSIFSRNSDLDLLQPADGDSQALEDLLQNLGFLGQGIQPTPAVLYSRRQVWSPPESQGGADYDQVSILLPAQKTVFDWIRVEQDFDFCKVAYDGRKLVIFEAKALLHRRTPFPMPGSTCGLSAMRYRVERYKEKGFIIDVPPEVQKLFDEEDARREQWHARRVQRRQRYVRMSSCGCCG